jgi:hypothetical protein
MVDSESANRWGGKRKKEYENSSDQYGNRENCEENIGRIIHMEAFIFSAVDFPTTLEMSVRLACLSLATEPNVSSSFFFLAAPMPMMSSSTDETAPLERSFRW